MPESARGKHATPGQAVFEGSWVVISGVISPLIWVIIMVTLLITPLITTHEPPSTAVGGPGNSVFEKMGLGLRAQGLDG